MRRVRRSSRVGVRFLLLSICALALGVTAVACGSNKGHGTLVFTRVGPDAGVVDGGSAVMIFGSNLQSPASVLFGGSPGSNVQVVDSHTITCVAPAHAAGTVDVVLHSAGRTASKVEAFRFIPGTETEPNNQNGVNDDFSHYELIPLDYDFKGYIGTQNDVDVLHIHTPLDGKLTLSFDWSASYTSGGLAGLHIEFFHGPDPTPSPDAYLGGEQIAVNSSGKLIGWTRMSYLFDGHGPFLRISGISDALHPAGYDPVHPYTVHVHWEPGAVESGNPADAFLFPNFIAPGTGASQATIQEQSDYDQDYDWYAFSATADGWARVVMTGPQLDTDTSFSASIASGTLFDGANVVTLNPLNGASGIAGDLPTPGEAAFETPLLQAGHTYYLRLVNNANVAFTPTFPYSWSAKVEMGAGNFESQQPGGDLPAEVESSANVVTLSAIGTAVQKTDYMYHLGDRDWFEVHTPAGAVSTLTINWDHTAIRTAPAGTTSLTIDWDHTAIRTALGDFDLTHKPLGCDFGVMAFDSTWFGTPGHTASPAETIGGTGFDFSTAVNTHQLTVPVAQNSTYYILLEGIHGFDEADSYTVSFTAN